MSGLKKKNDEMEKVVPLYRQKLTLYRCVHTRKVLLT